MTILPNAKINIGLNIVGKRPDGYHNLESIFYPIGICDRMQVDEARDLPKGTCALSLSGITIEGRAEDNLVTKAYHIIHKEHDIPAVCVQLDKQIPTGAGLGGGSSDAAYMLKALNELFSLHIPTDRLETYAAMLGADCAFFIKNQPVYVTGIGNKFHYDVPIPSLAGKTLLLVKPDVFVSTRDAYSHVRPKPASHPLPQTIQLPLQQWQGRVVNDFEHSVFPQFPLIQQVKDQIYTLGASYASMSGSGSTVFGIFETPVNADLDNIFPGMYTAQIDM